MSESKRKLVGRVALLLALAGLSAGFTWFWHSSDEERPPIIVDTSEIEFRHGHKWKDHGGGMRWKPDHGRGRNVTGFDVIAVDKSGVKVCVAYNQPTVVVDYMLTGRETVQFTLDMETRGKKVEPRLSSKETLTYVGENKRRVKLAKEGLITRVVAGETPCPFSDGAKVRIIIIPNH